MNKSKQIKTQIKNLKQWRKYKKVFHHPQMRLLFSRIALMLDPEINLKFLLDKELLLIQIEKSPEMFVEIYQSLESVASLKCDWTTFGKFIWYIYQTSTYWKDTKKKRGNIFTRDNYLEQNQIKRELYQQWLDSIDKSNCDFNNYIIEISRMVF